MSSEKFEDQEDELKAYFDELQNVIKNKLPRLGGEQRKAELRNVDKMIEDANYTLTSMTEEAQAAPGAYRSSMMSKVRGYRFQFDKLKKEKGKIAFAPGAGSRDELFGGGEAVDAATAQRNRMLEGLESLNKSSASLARSQRIAAETDEVGVQIIGDLDDQREALLRTRDRLKDTDQDLGRSRRILNSMAIRVATNKLILAVIIFVELVILGAVVYLRFFKKKKK